MPDLPDSDPGAHTIWYVATYASPQRYVFETRHFYLGSAWARRGHRACVITSNASHMTDALPVFDGARLVEEIDGVTAVWLNMKPILVYGTGANVPDWLYVDDHVRSLVAAFERGRAGERTPSAATRSGPTSRSSKRSVPFWTASARPERPMRVSSLRQRSPRPRCSLRHRRYENPE